MRTFILTASLEADDDAVRTVLSTVNDRIEEVLADDEVMAGVASAEVGSWVEQVEHR